MSDFEALADARAFSEFPYQLIYLRPSDYADERIAVGVVAESSPRLDSRFVSSVDAIGLMSRLIGEDGVEQYQYALAGLRRSISATRHLTHLRMPTDLLVTGETLVAYTSDRGGLLSSILSSSCLMRRGPEKRVDLPSANSAIEFSKDLFSHVSRLDPFIAERIFNQRVTIEDDEVELPIFGSRIFGAPVSFAIKDQTMRTEAYIAKFRWLRDHLRQQPRVYVLRPRGSANDRGTEQKLRSLNSIADALDVPLRMSDTTEGVATQILQDEAA